MRTSSQSAYIIYFIRIRSAKTNSRIFKIVPLDDVRLHTNQSDIRYNTIQQYKAIQYNTEQFNTIQHNMTQDNTLHHDISIMYLGPGFCVRSIRSWDEHTPVDGETKSRGRYCPYADLKGKCCDRIDIEDIR